MEIYIVEDDVTVISILEDIIEDNELGTVCGTTEGGPANVDEILALEPDVILVDFLMPGKDGVELTLQEDPSLVGGFILAVGDSVLDKSIRTAILKMQRHFAVR